MPALDHVLVQRLYPERVIHVAEAVDAGVLVYLKVDVEDAAWTALVSDSFSPFGNGDSKLNEKERLSGL